MLRLFRLACPSPKASCGDERGAARILEAHRFVGKETQGLGSSFGQEPGLNGDEALALAGSWAEKKDDSYDDDDDDGDDDDDDGGVMTQEAPALLLERLAAIPAPTAALIAGELTASRARLLGHRHCCCISVSPLPLTF